MNFSATLLRPFQPRVGCKLFPRDTHRCSEHNPWMESQCSLCTLMLFYVVPTGALMLSRAANSPQRNATFSNFHSDHRLFQWHLGTSFFILSFICFIYSFYLFNFFFFCSLKSIFGFLLSERTSGVSPVIFYPTFTSSSSTLGLMFSSRFFVTIILSDTRLWLKTLNIRLAS